MPHPHDVRPTPTLPEHRPPVWCNHYRAMKLAGVAVGYLPLEVAVRGSVFLALDWSGDELVSERFAVEFDARYWCEARAKEINPEISI